MPDSRTDLRYERQMRIPEIGKAGQARLAKAHIFIAGAGGLGSPVAIYLAAAGIGHLRIADHDRVDTTNLNRQVLHWEEDIGRPKTDSAREKLQRLNPHIRIEIVSETIGQENIERLLTGCHGIVDALDNWPVRYLLNRAAIVQRIPLFHGAVQGFDGRATTVIPGQSACLRCQMRGPIPAETFPVIGVTPAIIAGIQATEVIKYIVRAGELLTDTLLSYSGLNMTFTRFKLKRNPDCDHCGHLERKE